MSIRRMGWSAGTARVWRGSFQCSAYRV